MLSRRANATTISLPLLPGKAVSTCQPRTAVYFDDAVSNARRRARFLRDDRHDGRE